MIQKLEETMELLYKMSNNKLPTKEKDTKILKWCAFVMVLNISNKIVHHSKKRKSNVMGVMVMNILN